jgi:uncharacterized protein (DUF305 family)
MGQFMVDVDETRRKLLAQNAVQKPKQKTLAELQREAELAKESIPWYVKELNPSDADVIRKGPKEGPEASAKQNAWIWYYGMEQDPRFKKLSMGEQNSWRMEHFNKYILPYAESSEEATSLRKAFASKNFGQSFVTGFEQTSEFISPPVIPQEDMRPKGTYREMGATPDPMQMLISSTKTDLNVDPNAPPPALNPLGAAMGNITAGLIPYMIAGTVAPPVVAAHPFLSGMLRGAVTMAIPQAHQLLAGRITPGEALKGTIQGTLAFGPRKIWQGIALAAGWDAATGRGPTPSYTGVPALDRALTSAASTAVMRYAFEAPHNWEAFQNKAYNDKLSNYIKRLSYQESHINLLAEKSKTRGELRNFESRLIDRVKGLRQFTPSEGGIGVQATHDKDRITPVLPAEEQQAIERNTKIEQEEADRRMKRAATELVPLLEARGNTAQVTRLQIAADRLRASFGKDVPESEKLDAHMNWANTVDLASTAVGRSYPELVFGGNALVTTTPEIRTPEARSKIGILSRIFLDAWEAKPPTIDIARWKTLSAEPGPNGVSERAEYLRELTVGPGRAFTEKVLESMRGVDSRSIGQIIQIALERKHLGEPTNIDGLGRPKVSLLGQRNTQVTKAGAVPQDPEMQDNLRDAQFLLTEIDHATGLSDRAKADLKRMILNGTMPPQVTGRLQVYPKHLNSVAEAKSKQAAELSDVNAKLIIAEHAKHLGGPVLTEAQARASVLAQVPEGKEPPALIATGQFKPELQPGQGAADRPAILAKHFTSRYDSLLAEGYTKIDAYDRVMEELAALGEGPPLSDVNISQRIAGVAEKVAARSATEEFPPEQARGLDFKTLEDDSRVLDSMGGRPYEGMTRGETEANPLAVSAELLRTGLNGRYNRETNDIEVETVPGSRNFVKVSFQELQNFSGPGNFTSNGQLILETRGGTYMIVHTKDGKFDVVERNKAQSKGPQRPLTPTEIQAVLYSNTGWKVEVFFPDGSLQVFDPSTRETRLVTPEEAQRAVTQPREVEEACPGFPGRPNPESYDPTSERDTPTDSLPSFPEESLPKDVLSADIIYRQKGIYSRVLNTKTGEIQPYRGSILPHEIRYAINDRTGRVSVSELGSRATLPADIPAELRVVKRTSSPALSNVVMRYKAEYETKVPLPPHATIEQRRDWREGMAAYIASRIKRGSTTLGMSAVENPFGKKPIQERKKASNLSPNDLLYTDKEFFQAIREDRVPTPRSQEARESLERWKQHFLEETPMPFEQAMHMLREAREIGKTVPIEEAATFADKMLDEVIAEIEKDFKTYVKEFKEAGTPLSKEKQKELLNGIHQEYAERHEKFVLDYLREVELMKQLLQEQGKPVGEAPYWTPEVDVKEGKVTRTFKKVYPSKPSQAEFKASIEELTRQQRERERPFTEAEAKAEEALKLQVNARAATEGKFPTDEIDEMQFIREFLQNELKKPERGRGTIMHMGAPSLEEAPGFIRNTVGRVKTAYQKRSEIGPPGLLIPTKDVFSVLQEGKIGQKYGLRFYDLWRMVENYAISTRSWAKELAPKEAALLKILKTRNQDAIRAYLEVDPKDWEGKLKVRNTYNMRKEDIDLAPHVQSLLEKAFGKYWREFLTVHLPSYRDSKLGNNESTETTTMKTWREKGGLKGNPTDFIEMIPNAISARARMSMLPAFDKIDETVKKINDYPEDLSLDDAYQSLKGRYVDARGPRAAEMKAEYLKTMKEMENEVMPRSIKQELIGKLINYRARVSWGVSTDHAAAQTFLETVYQGAGINVDKELFGKILPNYLLLTYTATMPGRIGMVLRNLAQPTMTLLPYVGPENFARGQQVYWAHVSGVKRIPELDVLFKELGVDKLQGASTEQLLENQVETSTVPKIAATKLRRIYNAAMKPFNWSELTNRRISVTTGYLAMKDFGSQYLLGNMSAQTLMRRTGMIYMEKASQAEIMDTLNAKNLDLASKRFAQNLSEDTQWMYSAGNTPELFNSKMGRFFGQFGTWPLSFWRFAKRGAMSGDKIANMQFITRMVMVNAALDQATKKVLGVNAGSWLWMGPFSYMGGPGASLFASAYYAAGKGFRHELGMHDLLNQVTNLIPFYMAGRDINRAINAEDLPTALKAITGFRPYEK